VLSEKDFCEESLAVLKWLIAIPSITRTSGDELINHTIYNTVSEFTYFKNHPEYLNYVTHDDQKTHSFTAFVRRDILTTQTLVVLCNTDTSSNEVYGTLKSYAFKSDELKKKLKAIAVTDAQKAALNNENNIYGLGSFENKSPIAGMLILLKYYTERLWELPCNLLFVCDSESLDGHEGIRTCLPYIHNLINDEKIDLTLALSFKPESQAKDPNTINIYTANMGKVEAGFYILGEGTDTEQPFKGFSPTLIASKIIEEVELNAKIAQNISHSAIAPTFNYMHSYNNRSPNTPDVVHLSFNFPFINLNLLDLLENLKHVAAKAIEKSAGYMEDRETLFCKINEIEPYNATREAEVLSFSDLFIRASYHYKGNLKSAIEGLIQKCANEDLSNHDIIKTVIERLNELARLPRPSVVIFFGNDFIPQQQLRRNNSKDRELYIRLNKAVEEFNKDHENQLSIENECPANDNCFIRPVGIDIALKALKDECPIPVSTFYNLNAPGITFSYKGGDLYRAFEHVDKTFFNNMITFVHILMKEIGPEDNMDFVEKATDEALSILSTSNELSPGDDRTGKKKLVEDIVNEEIKDDEDKIEDKVKTEDKVNIEEIKILQNNVKKDDKKTDKKEKVEDKETVTKPVEKI